MFCQVYFCLLLFCVILGLGIDFCVLVWYMFFCFLWFPGVARFRDCCVACYYGFIRRALVFVAGAYVRCFVCARVEGCPEVWVISTRGFWWIGRLILGSDSLWVYSGGDCLASWVCGFFSTLVL